MLVNFTSMPSRLPTSVIRSISKPTILPLRVLEFPRNVADIGADIDSSAKAFDDASDASASAPDTSSVFKNSSRVHVIPLFW